MGDTGSRSSDAPPPSIEAEGSNVNPSRRRGGDPNLTDGQPLSHSRVAARRVARPTRPDDCPRRETRLRPSLGPGHTLLKLLRYLASLATERIDPGIDMIEAEN
jgi:hypothetical protein